MRRYACLCGIFRWYGRALLVLFENVIWHRPRGSDLSVSLNQKFSLMPCGVNKKSNGLVGTWYDLAWLFMAPKYLLYEVSFSPLLYGRSRLFRSSHLEVAGLLDGCGLCCGLDEAVEFLDDDEGGGLRGLCPIWLLTCSKVPRAASSSAERSSLDEAAKGTFDGICN